MSLEPLLSPTSHPASTPPRQPWLHDLSIVVAGNATVLSARCGDVRLGTAQGLLVDDRRVVDLLELTLDAEAPVPVADRTRSAVADFLGVARHLGDDGPDPTVEVHRVRRLGGDLVEEVTVRSRASAPVRTVLRWRVGGDGLDIATVKSGVGATARIPAEVLGDGVVLQDDWHRTVVTQEPRADLVVVDDGDGVLETLLEVAPGGSVRVTLTVSTTRLRASAFDADPGGGAVGWTAATMTAGHDHRVATVFAQGTDDLRHLLLSDPEAPDDVFAAAGSPWYLTLFGRDSLWAARMSLPFGTALAGGTLRALARRQGQRVDATTGEAPGKIPHELRRHLYRDEVSGMVLPQVYYGTVDATALWVSLLVDARRWGLPRDEVVALLPALRAALGWLTGAAQPDGDGLLKYLDESGTGLANQGWKDSGDAIRWRDGRVAEGPIALVEAQAYAAEALSGAARLLGELAPDVQVSPQEVAELEAGAERLTALVRSRFWVTTTAGRHLGLAVDGAGLTVDGLASNMGHVLGTGVLDDGESRQVAQTLMGPELLGEFGIRTLGSGNGGFNPIGYHTGSIWTHDTAIAAWGLHRAGYGAHAVEVARTLVASADPVDGRWAELYSGVPLAGRPTPYPAACRPQAWSAASAAVIAHVALGLEADVPARRLRLRPTRALGPLEVTGLRWGGSSYAVVVDAQGEVTVTGLPADVQVDAQPADPTP